MCVDDWRKRWWWAGGILYSKGGVALQLINTSFLYWLYRLFCTASARMCKRSSLKCSDRRCHAEPENVCTKCLWLVREKRAWIELVRKSLIKLSWFSFFFLWYELVSSLKWNNFAESEFAFSGVPTQPCQPNNFQNKVRCQHIISMTFFFRLLLSWQTTWTHWVLADGHIAPWPAELTKSMVGAACRHKLDAGFCTTSVSVLTTNLLLVL